MSKLFGFKFNVYKFKDLESISISMTKRITQTIDPSFLGVALVVAFAIAIASVIVIVAAVVVVVVATHSSQILADEGSTRYVVSLPTGTVLYGTGSCGAS